MLYAADVDEVVGIDIKTGTILERNSRAGGIRLE
jgi:hypothetical protein